MTQLKNYKLLKFFLYLEIYKLRNDNVARGCLRYVKQRREEKEIHKEAGKEKRKTLVFMHAFLSDCGEEFPLTRVEKKEN